MSTRREAWTDKLFEVLADGAWHSREELVVKAGGVVPASRAFRLGERERLRRTGGHARERSKGTDEDSILTGRRDIVNASLAQQVGTGRLERSEDGRSFRLGTCQECGRSLRPQDAPQDTRPESVRLAEELLSGFRLDGARAVVAYDDVGPALVVAVSGREYELRVRSTAQAQMGGTNHAG